MKRPVAFWRPPLIATTLDGSGSEQQGESMSKRILNRSAPTATIVPVLIYDDVEEAIARLCEAFGFKERLRYTAPNGRVTHAQLMVAEGSIMIGGAGDDFCPPRSHEVHHYVLVHVEDVERHFEHTRASGMRILEPPVDHSFGERSYSAQDHAGHRWTFSQHLADVSPEEWGAVAAPE